jgi:hypothetical protein
MDTGFAENIQRQLGQNVEAQVKELSSTLRDLNGRALTYVRERPVACVIGAFAVGYLLAKVAKHV